MMRSQIAFFAVAVLTASIVGADDNLDEPKAIQKIELLGGMVTRDESLPGSSVTGVSFAESSRFGERHLHLLKPFKKLKTLDLSRARFSDSSVKGLIELQSLTTLCNQYDWRA